MGSLQSVPKKQKKMRVLTISLTVLLLTCKSLSAPVESGEDNESNTGEGTVEEVAMATKSDQVKVVNHVKGLLNDIVANKEEGVDKPSPERVQILNTKTDPDKASSLEAVEILPDVDNTLEESNDEKMDKKDMENIKEMTDDMEKEKLEVVDE